MAFQTPIFPDKPFVLVDDSGADDGPFRPADFAHNGDGVWVAQTEGHPVFLRITRQYGNEIWTQDGTGKTWHYRMVSIDVRALTAPISINRQA